MCSYASLNLFVVSALMTVGQHQQWINDYHISGVVVFLILQV